MSLRCWSDGKVEIWKDGVKQGTHVLGPGTSDPGSASAGSPKGSEYHDLVVLPQRRRELLVYSPSSGESFVHIFADIDEQDVDRRSSRRSVLVLDRRDADGVNTVDVEIAPVRYPAVGTATSAIYAFGIAPRSGQELVEWTNPAWGSEIERARLYGDSASVPDTNERVSVVDVLTPAGGAFTPDGEAASCRVKLTIRSDDGGGYTPTIYGLHAAYAPEFALTDGSEPFDLSPVILKAELTGSDRSLGVRVVVTFKRAGGARRGGDRGRERDSKRRPGASSPTRASPATSTSAKR